jgi:DNA-binding PadR family transcriptional regulator
MSRDLGKVQINVLGSLESHRGTWWAGCGWYWDTYSGTNKLLQSLFKRGLVDHAPNDTRFGVFTINDKGRETLVQLRTERK